MSAKDNKLTPANIRQTAERLQTQKHKENQRCHSWPDDPYLSGYDQGYWDALNHLLEQLGIEKT